MSVFKMVKFAARGKGQAGQTIDVAIVGTPVLDDKGVCKDITYDSLPREQELRDYVKSLDYDFTEVLAMGINAKNRSMAATGGMSAEIRNRILAQTDISNEKQIRAAIAAVLNLRSGVVPGITLDLDTAWSFWLKAKDAATAMMAESDDSDDE